MTNTTMGSLREVQKLDERIEEIRHEVEAFDERLADVEEPALALEAELSQLRQRLQQMEADARKLERSADDKRARAEKLEQRLTRVSNLREEAAVKTELDLIRRAIGGDEQEALQLLDQIRRSELAEEDLATRAEQAREDVEPSQASMREERDALHRRMVEFQERRHEILAHVAPMERRVYDSFHQSGRAVVVAALLEDGACGNCFGVIPLQVQNEVRHAESLIRCEACGVILTSEPEPVLDPEITEPLARAGEEEAEDGEGEGSGPEGADGTESNPE
jgi:predicted  nucleic acid-binding Zn-ribbon protein